MVQYGRKQGPHGANLGVKCEPYGAKLQVHVLIFQEDGGPQAGAGGAGGGLHCRGHRQEQVTLK